MSDLLLSQQRRAEEKLDLAIDSYIDGRLARLQLAAPIAAPAKIKLRNILKYYAKQAHPFRACVKDNMARFGPGRVEAVCATLKDEIRGNKDWRKGGSAKMGEAPIIDGDVLLALDAISEVDLEEIFMEARALDEHGTKEAVVLLEVSGESELLRWGCDAGVDLAISAVQRHALKPEDFVFPKEEGYPVDTEARARSALSRGAQHESGARLKAIVAKVRARYPNIEIGDDLLKKAGLKK